MTPKRTYITPETTQVGHESMLPVMGTMTLYTCSPYTTLTTVDFGPGGFGSSEGSW